ncbi:conserved hypothetical protein [Caldicellulosiruptor hydrothermalis 108]|uniref:Uncharacterized protein n=1 Tax=Caldicellulosiruptor hydrothermalis (strain DSM 18901 / VKM B-2411 / 108) TaxID=632292 RepID=E4Q991_CALH1|nr:DUF5696 domain-containing protein [Caldicellulosiruptor hydrothermalis]ADQ08140.1 conserved hypothetical protein [Caldicellulosiruptor hydrothermalis 108]
MSFNKLLKKAVLFLLAVSMLLEQMMFLQVNTAFADTNSYQLVAKNGILELYVNPKYGYFKVVDKRSGSVWFSNPEKWREDKIAAGSTRMQMASQLSIRFTDVTSTIQIANAYVNSVLKKGLKIKRIKDGFVAMYTFKKEGFVIPVAYTIKDDYLNVDILVNQIKETKKDKYKLVSIMLLPFFGAAAIGENGYMVVPDGCGALINFNNNKGQETYTQRIYGADFGIVPDFQGYVTQAARLPVFGMKKENSGFLAVITKGDGKAILNANTSGSKSSYNNIFAEFVMREYDMVTLKEKQWDERSFNIFEEKLPNVDKFSIRYYFLDSKNADYVAMAKKYREYLIKERGFKKEADEKSVPVYIEFYGSMKKPKYILGIPVNATIPLTTFEDAQKIVKQVKSMGVSNVVVKFVGWMKNGVYYNLPLLTTPEGVLGGKKQLENVLEYFQKANVKTYLDVDFVLFRTGTLMYLRNKVATKSMKKVPAQLWRYSPPIFYKDDSYPVLYLISPRYTNEIVQRFLANSNINYFNNISLSSMSTMLYSDFGTRPVNRYQTEDVFLQAIDSLSKRFRNILLTNPNGYLLQKASEIVDVPIYSSKFLIEDAEIPFYQMVIRGYVPYSMPSVNFYTNEWMWKLKALETGSAIKFTWTARNEDELKETLLESLYSSNYRMWLGDLKEYYKELYPTLRLIKGKEIVEHKIIKKGVVKVVYDGGVEILLNYTSSPQKIENLEVAAQSYKVVVKR